MTEVEYFQIKKLTWSLIFTTSRSGRREKGLSSLAPGALGTRLGWTKKSISEKLKIFESKSKVWSRENWGERNPSTSQRAVG